MKHTLALFIMLASLTNLFAQGRVSKHTTVKSDNISISYGQPAKKGRVIFGELVPYGQVWRTGADEATEITFKKDYLFGGKKIAAGTYSLFTIPGKNEWTVILNPTLKQWGAYGYEKVKDKNVLETKVAASATGKTVEIFTIEAADSKVTMEWDDTRMVIPAKAL